MKKVILLVMFLLFIHYTYCQQGIFYKARYLDSLYNDITKKIPLDGPTIDALKEFYPPNTNIDTALLNKNPFFYKLFEPAPGSQELQIFHRCWH